MYNSQRFYANIRLRQTHIEQHQPILQRLQAKTAQNEHNTDYTKPPLRQVIGVILDLRIDCHSNPADNPGHQPHANRKCPGMIDMMDEIRCK